MLLESGVMTKIISLWCIVKICKTFMYLQVKFMQRITYEQLFNIIRLTCRTCCVTITIVKCKNILLNVQNPPNFQIQMYVTFILVLVENNQNNLSLPHPYRMFTSVTTPNKGNLFCDTTISMIPRHERAEPCTQGGSLVRNLDSWMISVHCSVEV